MLFSSINVTHSNKFSRGRTENTLPNLKNAVAHYSAEWGEMVGFTGGTATKDKDAHEWLSQEEMSPL